MSSPSRRRSGGVPSIEDVIDFDVFYEILSRLPTVSFGSAACVNRYWNSVCGRILSKPKLSSALSLNPCLEGAVNEVVEKVMSVPIRPHFVIASVGGSFDLIQAHQLITGRFRSSVPVVTSESYGIIGREALTNEFKEVRWKLEDDYNEDLGIVLTVGYLPGVESTLIPARYLYQADQIKKFVTDIRTYASDVSDMSPSAIILFSDLNTDMRPVLQNLDDEFPVDTVIVGEGGRRCMFRSNWDEKTEEKQDDFPDAVALVFAKNKASGIGEIHFHARLSSGLRPVPPEYEANSIVEHGFQAHTWFKGRAGAGNENLGGLAIVEKFYNEIRDDERDLERYIGVWKIRSFSSPFRAARWRTFLDFHEEYIHDEHHVAVSGLNIKTRDRFCLFISDYRNALASRDFVSQSFGKLAASRFTQGKKRVVFGGIIFACCLRGESFYRLPVSESSLFLDSFPGVPLGGSFSSGEIDVLDELGIRCGLHFFSTVYLVLSYIPLGD